MREKGSELAGSIVDYNRRNKADIELRKCLKCLHFDRKIYKCKQEKCFNSKKSG